MGKKSRRGTSRAGTKNRPKAGQGKSRTRSRSFEGSQASSDILQNETISVDSTDPLPPVKTEVAPGGVSTPRNMEIAVTQGATSGAAKNDVASPPMEVISTAATAKETKIVPDDVVEKAVMEAVSGSSEPVAAKPITPASVPDTPTAVSTPEVKSRGLALDQPAPEEASAKQKDCECIIL
jgi:hypothetical protein